MTCEDRRSPSKSRQPPRSRPRNARRDWVHHRTLPQAPQPTGAAAPAKSCRSSTPRVASEDGDFASSHRSRSARTGGGSSPPARTRRRGCGTPTAAASSPILTGHEPRSRRVAFSPDGKRHRHRQRGQDGAGVGRRHRPANRSTLTGHTGAGAGRGVQPGRQAASSPPASDKTARVWDADDAAGEPHPARAHERVSAAWRSAPTASASSPPAADKTARVWDAATGHELLTLTGHTSAVLGVAFSPDGQADRHRQRGQDGAGVGRRHRPELTSPSPGTRVLGRERGVQPRRQAHRHRQRRRDGAGVGRATAAASSPHPQRATRILSSGAWRSAPTASGSPPAARTAH